MTERQKECEVCGRVVSDTVRIGTTIMCRNCAEKETAGDGYDE